MEKLKQNWKIILIVILALFGLSKCTQSCNRETHYVKAQKEADSLTLVIDSQNKVINNLCKDTANYINQIRMYKDFDIKRDTQDSINNANLASQKAQTDKLIQQNRQLINSRR